MTNSDTIIPSPSSNTTSYQIVHVENTSGNISKVVFNGNNYDAWSRSFTLALLAKGKLGYVDGSIPKPSLTDPKFEAWQSTNALVTAWIYNSMADDIGRSISCRPEARQVWADIKTRFCQGNDTRIYRLESELMACRQGPNESLMAYYGRINTLWDELATYDPLPSCSCTFCPCDWVALMDTRRDRKRVRNFLLGLDDRYDNARSHLLGTNPLPSLNIIYNRLLQEEGVRNLSQTRTDAKPDVMAFATRTHNNHNANQDTRRSRGGRDTRVNRNPNNTPSDTSTLNNPPSKYFCDACQRWGHSLPYCFRVTGKFPEWWGDRPRDRIYLDSNHPNDLNKAVFVPDTQGRAQFDRNKQPSQPRAHMAGGAPTGTGLNHPTGQEASVSVSLSSLDNIDLNALNPSELAELTRVWKQHKSASSDRLHGPFLEDGDWSG